MKNNKLIKLFSSQVNSSGYTLTELIIGASISVVVIGAAGMGLMNMLQGNKTSTAEGDRISEVNRSLEFISDEVRRAERIETAPTADLPSGFDPSGKEVVLALDLPDLGQDKADTDEKVIYYVRPKPNNTWLGPNVIYRYGPPLDTSGGSYTGGDWVEQALIDRINAQTLTPTCDNNETAIEAQGFAACVDNGQKVAQIFVNGQFLDDGGNTYQADVQVYARATEADLEGKDSDITFNIIPGGGSGGGSSSVKIVDSQMGCNPSGEQCSVTTQFYEQDGTTPIGSPITSGEIDVNIGTNAPFVVKVTPSTPGLTNPYPSYFDEDGNPQAGEQNNSKSISVKVDLSKDYLKENPLTILDSDFKIDQVKLLGDKSPLPDKPAWNPEKSDVFDTLTEILGTKNFLDKDGDLQLESNQYLLVFEVGQTDTNHPGFDLQDQILLITVD